MSRPAAARFGHTASLKLKLSQITGYKHTKVMTEIGTRPSAAARARAEVARARRELRGLPTHAGGGTSATRASPRSSLSHACR